MKKQLLTSVAAFSVGFLIILAGLYAYQKVNAPAARPPNLPNLLWPNPKQLSDFRLTDQVGGALDLGRVKGKWTFWYFGYTNCPDACPTTLTVMTGIHKLLQGKPDLRDTAQFSFVSLDPARDSIEHLKTYVGFFNPAFIAATGTDAEIKAVTGQFGVAYAFREPDADGNYVVDHTAAILLTDPQARLVAIFSPPHKATDITDQLARIEAFITGH